VSTTVNPAGTSRWRRRTPTTARAAEQSQATSSAPLAAAISAARPSLQLSARAAVEPWTAADPSRGVNAASAAMSAAVWAAALAPASAPMSTAATPANSTSPANANPTRVAPPSSPTRQGTATRVGRSAAVIRVGLIGRWGAGAGLVRERRRRWR
jgi:hypothetical protein